MSQNLLIYDTHLHTHHSLDSEASMDELCLTAIEKNLTGITITDHCECNEFYDPACLYCDIYDQSAQEILQCRERYGNRIEIGCGIELGAAVQDLEIAERVSQDPRFDFVIGSIHSLTGYGDFYFMDYSDKDVDKLMELYLDEMLRTVQWGKFHTLAHITYPLRYIKPAYSAEKLLQTFDAAIQEVLRELVQRGIAMEINVSGLRNPIDPVTYPTMDYAKRYRELGGEMITIGTDSHTPDTVGYGVSEVMEMLAECGFRYVTHFYRRQPIMTRLK